MTPKGRLPKLSPSGWIDLTMNFRSCTGRNPGVLVSFSMSFPTTYGLGALGVRFKFIMVEATSSWLSLWIRSVYLNKRANVSREMSIGTFLSANRYLSFSRNRSLLNNLSLYRTRDQLSWLVLQLQTDTSLLEDFPPTSAHWLDCWSRDDLSSLVVLIRLKTSLRSLRIELFQSTCLSCCAKLSTAFDYTIIDILFEKNLLLVQLTRG